MVTKVVGTKLTEEEHTKLLDACNTEGCTPSRFIKNAIISALDLPENETKVESADDQIRKMLNLDKKDESKEMTIEQLGEELGLVKKKDVGL